MGGAQRVLVANRGEIAVRIVRACADVGFSSVAVHGADEAGGGHLAGADDVLALPGTGPAAHLDVDALVAAAAGSGATLLHPGYGFLAEDAGFARACAAAGLTFVGPDPDTLELLGDKIAARALAAELRVPVLAATDGACSLAEAHAFLASLGAGGAVMVKALSGGGGRGLRVVRGPGELDDAWARAGSEAAVSSRGGDPELYLEALVARARHVEVQLVGDGSGSVAVVGDRDCSLQRRHQKLVEIAPAPGLPDGLRARLADDARRIGEQVALRGLATVEFLLDLDALERGATADARVFLEINPRVQVEHTVTEEVYGVDLVAAQLRLAAGETLTEVGLDPEVAFTPVGTAIEARCNAEQLRADGSVTAADGRLTRFELPSGPGVRVDTAARAGSEVSVRFDPLLAKVVARAPGTGPVALTTAITRLDRALVETHVAGVETNVALLRALLADPAVRAGAATTHHLDAHRDELLAAASAVASELSASGRYELDADIGHGPASGSTGSLALPAGSIPVAAELQGVVVEVPVEVGERVGRGRTLVVLEAMKMEQAVPAPVAGEVTALAVAVGDAVATTDVVAALAEDPDGGEEDADVTEVDLDHVRDDLAEVHRRRALRLDAARPDAVARRHGQGHLTAREKLDLLIDPDTWVEYGGLVHAAQRRDRDLDDLLARTPADGLIAGLGRLRGTDAEGDAGAHGPAGNHGPRCAVVSYDYTVLAGTQGHYGHLKKDRIFGVIRELRTPVVLLGEGGGGRPSDTDVPVSSGLDVPSFARWASLSGLVPRIAVVSGPCFAGNAALAGCSDVIVATADSSIGMGGPAMIEGGGLGTYEPGDVGPMSVQAANGVADVVVDDDAAALAVARTLVGYFSGSVGQWDHDDQRRLRHLVPERRTRVYDVRAVMEVLFDTGSVTELRAAFACGMVTAFARLEGRPVGVIANDPGHLAGAITSDGADKAARFWALCDAFDLPVINLIDTPGMMVGPEAERTGLVRHTSRLFVTAASATVPLVSVVLRKGYGLGAQAMTGGGFHEPLLTVAWPTGEFGAMNPEGAVQLALRKQLDAIEDPDERARVAEQATAALYERGRATSTATYFELDDVIDPADTRRTLIETLAAAPTPPDRSAPGATRVGKKRPMVDPW